MLYTLCDDLRELLPSEHERHWSTLRLDGVVHSDRDCAAHGIDSEWLLAPAESIHSSRLHDVLNDTDHCSRCRRCYERGHFLARWWLSVYDPVLVVGAVLRSPGDARRFGSALLSLAPTDTVTPDAVRALLRRIEPLRPSRMRDRGEQGWVLLRCGQGRSELIDTELLVSLASSVRLNDRFLLIPGDVDRFASLGVGSGAWQLDGTGQVLRPALLETFALLHTEMPHDPNTAWRAALALLRRG